MAKSRKRTESAALDTHDHHSGQHGDALLASSGQSRERIAARAYELYLQRGGADGGDFDDWLAAEREISSTSAAPDDRDGRGE